MSKQSKGQEHWNQRKSNHRRFGVSKHEDYLEQCFLEMGLTCKRRQVFCFMCCNMWTNETYEYPKNCRICGTEYIEPRMFCMPDIVIENAEGSGAVIFVNGKHHEKEKHKKKDQFQINTLKASKWLSFTIWNEEVDYLRHANRCFLVLGIYQAMLDPLLYERGFENEKELLH